MAHSLGKAERQAKLILAEVEELAASCHTSRLRKVLKTIPPSSRSEAAGRALVYAAQRGEWELAQELLEMGADCTVKLASGSTALMYAAMGGSLALIRELLERGADLHARQDGTGGATVIEMAETPLVRRYLEKLAARAGK
jgi:hypothetical protein